MNLKYYKSPFHAMYPEEIADEVCEAFDKNIILPCAICGKEGRFRYAPRDGKDPNGTSLPYEASRWRCTEHQPYDATHEGWNGEWDDISQEEPSK